MVTISLFLFSYALHVMPVKLINNTKIALIKWYYLYALYVLGCNELMYFKHKVATPTKERECATSQFYTLKTKTSEQVKFKLKYK